MIAYVTKTFDETAGAGRIVRVKYSSDGGDNWSTRGEFAANTASRVDMTVTESSSGGYQIWQVAWVDAETYEAKLAMSINNGNNWYTTTFMNRVSNTSIKAIGGIDIACNSENICQMAYRNHSTSESWFFMYRSLHYNISVFFGILPILISDVNGPETIRQYNGGKSARLFMEDIATQGPSIDYHVNTGYGGYNKTTRAWRKLQSQSQAPYNYSFVGSVIETPYDIMNSSQVLYYGSYDYIFGYFMQPE